MKRYLLTTTMMLMLAVGTSAQNDEQHVRLTNLPHVYINTFTGNPITSKTTMVYAQMWYVDEADNVAFYDSLQIRVRGNSTASLAKKPYKLKFNEKVKLLGKGRPNTKKWTLLANHADKTLLRNAENARSRYGVLTICLVEVATTEQQYCIRVLRLQVEELLHHRGQLPVFLCHLYVLF